MKEKKPGELGAGFSESLHLFHGATGFASLNPMDSGCTPGYATRSSPL